MTKEESTLIRLKNEYDAIMRIPKNNGIYSAVPSPGQKPPYVRSYDVTFTVPTYVDEGRSIQQRTVVRVLLSDAFPEVKPRVNVIEGKCPFHVNWFTSGELCSGTNWASTMWLYDFFGFIGNVLQYQPDKVNVKSAANPAAIPFFEAHKNRDLPTDNRPMPGPMTKHRMSLTRK